jgi:hypothetical protein
MHRRELLIAITSVLAVGLVSLALLSSGSASHEGLIVFTEIRSDAADERPGARAAWASRLMVLDPADADAATLVLSTGFYAARDPAVSPEGETLLFAGKRGSEDPWQVWEMKVGGGRARLVTPGMHDHRHPAYLGDRRIVFSAASGNGANRERSLALHTSDLRGADDARITYHPAAEVAPTVMRDGRVLYVNAATVGGAGADRLMVVRYDGTGAQLLYASPDGKRVLGRAWETDDGRVVFVEARNEDDGGELVAVSLSRPLNSRSSLSSGIGGTFASVFPLTSGDLLVSYRPPEADRFGLHRFDLETQALTPLAGGPDVHAMEPVQVSAGLRPKVFVSVVDPTKATGVMYCLDADLSDRDPSGPSRTSTAVQVLGAHGLLGEVPLESDGSFKIELTASTPVRFQTLDAQGRLVRGPSDWVWVRPNENRGCIGCHEDRELAPPNRVPLAIEEPPMPVHAPAEPAADTSGGER